MSVNSKHNPLSIQAFPYSPNSKGYLQDYPLGAIPHLVQHKSFLSNLLLKAWLKSMQYFSP